MSFLKKLNAVLLGLFIFLSLSVSQLQAADTTVSGTIYLPGSVAAYSTNQYIPLRIYYNWNGNWFLNSINCGSSVELTAEETSVTFNCTVPGLTGEFAVEANGYNLDGIYPNNYYHRNGTEWQSDKAERLLSGNSYPDIDIVLLPGITLEGELQTPGTTTFTPDIDFVVYYQYYDYNSGWWKWGDGSGITLIGSDTTVSYYLRIPAHLEFVKIHYEWDETPEPTFTTSGYYNGSLGTQYHLDNAQPVNTLSGNVNGINMTLLQAPPNDAFLMAEVLPGENGVSSGVNYGASEETGEPPHARYGTKSVWYEWTATANGELQVTTAGSNFDTLLGVYTGTSVDLLTEVASNDDYNGLQSRVTFPVYQNVTYHIAVAGWNGDTGNISIDWEYSQTVFLSGTIGLPDSAAASEQLHVAMYAYRYNAASQQWDFISTNSANIQTGQNSVLYTLSVPPDSGDVVIQYALWGNSSDYIQYGYYHLPVTTSKIDLASPVSTATDQPDLNMTFIKYNSITGQISLAGTELAPKDIYIGLGALTQPDGDYHTTNQGLWYYHTTSKSRKYFLIPAGSNSVEYTLNLAEDIGEASIEYAILTSDVDYVKHGFYAADGGNNATGFFTDAGRFAANSNHPDTHMTMAHGFLVQGTVLLPEPAKRSEVVELGLRSVITGIDNFYDTTLFIPWQATAVDYSYRALFDSNAVMGMKTEGKNGYLPNLYYKTPTETVSDLALATDLNSGSIPASIDFNLYSWSGDVNLDTHVNLTDTILSLQTASGFTGLSVFKEGDATGDSRIGVEDAIYVLQEEAGMFEPVPCMTNDTCGNNQFCQKADCMDPSGFCVQIPSSGDCRWSITETVCGCDGETYTNACEAAIANTSVDNTGGACGE